MSYDVDGDPFGFGAGRAGQSPFPVPASRGAENLLVKAAAAWATGDDDRATSMLDRAAALPFDRREDAWPGPAAAHGLLFELVTHTVETGETREWFAAVDATFATLDDHQRDELGSSLADLIADWNLTPGLDRQLRALVAGRRTDEGWLHRDDLGPAAVRDGTERVLRVAVRLSEELEARGLCSHIAPEYW